MESGGNSVPTPRDYYVLILPARSMSLLSAPIQYDADFEEIADAMKRALNEFAGTRRSATIKLRKS